MEIRPFTYFTNQWTDFYMIGTSVIKELIDSINGMCNILACLSTLNLTLSMYWFLYDTGLRHERVKRRARTKTLPLNVLEKYFYRFSLKN